METKVWPATESEWCATFKRLDIEFNTDRNSPLHHDNRCSIHAKG